MSYLDLPNSWHYFIIHIKISHLWMSPSSPSKNLLSIGKLSSSWCNNNFSKIPILTSKFKIYHWQQILSVVSLTWQVQISSLPSSLRKWSAKYLGTVTTVSTHFFHIKNSISPKPQASSACNSKTPVIFLERIILQPAAEYFVQTSHFDTQNIKRYLHRVQI